MKKQARMIIENMRGEVKQVISGMSKKLYQNSNTYVIGLHCFLPLPPLRPS
jgi:hypothetical protein